MAQRKMSQHLLWGYVGLLTLLFLIAYAYVLETRPRIDVIADYPERDNSYSKSKMDRFGYDYPLFKIYHRNFWNTVDHQGVPLFEPHRNFWIGRLTDMEGFLPNHGRLLKGKKVEFLEQEK